jgi:hypothetical protein
MSFCDEFIEKLKKTLPELCIVRDLIDVGIYRSDQAAYHARKSGTSPDYFKLPHRGIVYPKKGIIEFLEKGKHSFSAPTQSKGKFVRKFK